MNREELYAKALTLPQQPGVYIMRDSRRNIIYIGKAKKLRNRVQSYFREGVWHQPKVERMVTLANDFDIIVTDSEFEALILECSLIKQHTPKYNILLKDDKGFSWIRVSDEDFPRITVALQKVDDGAQYIGPYLGSFAIRQLVDQATLAFGLPSCPRRFPQDFGKGRTCLNAHIGRCMGLCRGKVSKEEYAGIIADAVTYITKGSKEILRRMEDEMTAASERLEFESAAKLRDAINAIKKAESGQKVIHIDSDLDQDVFAFAASEKSICAVVLKFRDGRLVDKDEQIISDMTSLSEARDEFLSHYYISSADIPRRILVDEEFESLELVQRMLSEQSSRAVTIAKPQRGENAALLSMGYNNAVDRLKREYGRKDRDEASLGELANLLGLPDIPKTIEAYDISNYGSEAVGGMVVFQDGKPKRSDYKRFIIRDVGGVDDYASMREVMGRRIARYDEGKNRGFARRPDVILLDGGKGHLMTILEAVRGTSFEDVPFFGMVKDDKHRTRGIVAREGELSVAMHKTAFALISKIQDETHRYTVQYQRQRHSKNAFRSSLTDIQGVGEKRAKLLLRHFKTIEAIRNAALWELEGAEGLGKAAAKAVYDHYHPQEETGV